MSIDEKAFYYLWKFKKRLFDEKVPDYALNFEVIEDRLSILSSLLADQMIKVKKGKHLGGWIGDTLFFTPQVYLSENKKQNEQVYLHQMCFSITARQLGYAFHYDKVSSYQRLLITVCAIPSILLKMSEEYPVLCFECKDLYELYVQKKTPYHQKVLSPLAEVLEACFISQLCSSEQHQNKYPWMSELFSSEILSPEELLKRASQLKECLKSFKSNDKLFLPPFYSLMPLSGVIDLHKEEVGASQEANSLTPETVLKTDPKDIVKRVDLTEDENYNPASILMEGVQTADIFKGGLKRVDGSDELSEHQEGLDDLNIQEVVRTTKETKSIFQADIAYEVISDEKSLNPLENHLKAFSYPEWNYRKKKYLQNWCQVFEQTPSKKEQNQEDQEQLAEIIKENKKHIKELRHSIEKIILSRQWKNRQRNGEEVDIDAVVDGLSSIYGGKTPDERFYLSKRKKTRDISVVILLDASLSADSWVEGRRVLDIAKEAIVILQEALKDVFSEISIAAFNGQTRQKCEYFLIKDFKESWSTSYSKLFSVEPAGYTRIGAALRHCLTRISEVNSKKKVIFLLSDGKPTDYDVYEGKYGIQDVRHVIKEARQKNIDIFSLAIDQSAKYYFPQMFGKNNFKVLKHTKLLSDHFVQLFSKLI